jgi:hypothetical protein
VTGKMLFGEVIWIKVEVKVVMDEIFDILKKKLKF